MKLPIQADLTGKVAVVTGAGGVLCSMMAHALATAGAKVALLDLNEEAAQAYADEIVKEGFIAKGYKANVLDKESLKEALKKAKEINQKNDELSNTYGGNFAFVKTYQDLIEDTEIDKSDIQKTLKLIYEDIINFYNRDVFLVQGKKNFVDSVKQRLTIKLFQEGLYEKINDIYDNMLNDLFKNIQLYK